MGVRRGQRLWGVRGRERLCGATNVRTKTTHLCAHTNQNTQHTTHNKRTTTTKITCTACSRTSASRCAARSARSLASWARWTHASSAPPGCCTAALWSAWGWYECGEGFGGGLGEDGDWIAWRRVCVCCDDRRSRGAGRSRPPLLRSSLLLLSKSPAHHARATVDDTTSRINCSPALQASQ